MGDLVETEELPPVTLKGLARPVAPLNLVRLRDGAWPRRGRAVRGRA